MKHRIRKSAFTLTELLVLVAVGALLTTLLLPTLSETRAKMLQQACVANMKQWGMVFELYSQDFRGTLYYDYFGAGWDDSGISPPSPYGRYLIGTNANPTTTMRIIRLCPARAAYFPPTGPVLPRSYTMPIGMYRKGVTYAYANVAGSPYTDANGNYWPNLRSVRNPSQFLLLIEGRGNTIVCSSTALHDAVTQVHSGAPGDSLPAISWHASLVNCLFGDYHVEGRPLSKIDQMDGNCTTPTGNPYFNLN